MGHRLSNSFIGYFLYLSRFLERSKVSWKVFSGAPEIYKTYFMLYNNSPNFGFENSMAVFSAKIRVYFSLAHFFL